FNDRLLGRLPARGFAVIAEADAAQFAVAARLGPARFEPGPVGARQRLFHRLLEMPGIDQEADPVLVRQLLRADEIAPADFVAAEPQSAGSLIEQPLHLVGDLRPTGAAIGTNRHGVREGDAHRQLQGGHVVDRAGDARAPRGPDARPVFRKIGADLGEVGYALLDDTAVLVEHYLAYL